MPLPMSIRSSISPLPAGDKVIEATRESCAAVAQASGLTPNVVAIDTFLRNLDETTFQRLRTQHGLHFPLRFPTPTAEVNFLGILALLNAFSGYRTAFHNATGAGAYQNVSRLMIGLYITGSGAGEDSVVGSAALTAKGMSELSEATLVELLGVSVHEEKPHATLPGVTVGVRAGEMLQVVQLLLTTLKGVGAKLMDEGFASLGAYLVHLMTQAKHENLDDGAATDLLVKQIASTLPEFRDSYTLPTGQDVFLFKRIFFLLHSLHVRFATKQEWRIPNTYSTLPMFVDNVLPTLAVWFNLFSSPTQPVSGEMQTLHHWVSKAHCNAELTREILAGLAKNMPGPTLTVSESYTIRAATLHLGHMICQRACHLATTQASLTWLARLNEVDLDGYLWALAKDDSALRKVPRFVFPSIHF